MKRIVSALLAAAMLFGLCACVAQPQEEERDAAPLEAVESASPAAPTVLEGAEGLITDWVVKPTISANDIRPLVNDTHYRFMNMYENDLLAGSRGDYFRQVSVLRSGTGYGLVDYNGDMVLPAEYGERETAQLAGYVRPTFAGVEFAAWYDEEQEKLRPAIVVQADADEDRALEFLELDKDYQPTGKAQMVPGLGASLFLWLEGEKTLAYDYTNEGRLLPTAVNWDTPTPVRLASLAQEYDDEYDLYELDGMGMGYADKNGLLVDCRFALAQRPWEGIGAVKTGDGWYYITMDGEPLHKEPYDAVETGEDFLPGNEVYADEYVYDFSEGLVAVNRDGKWGYMDRQGNEVVPCVYDATRPVYNGMAWVRMMGKWGVADLSAFTTPWDEALPGGPVVDAPETGLGVAPPEGEGQEPDGPGIAEGAVAEQSLVFALFYLSYIEAINEQDPGELWFCTDRCANGLAERIFDSNNSAQTYEILEVAVDLDSADGAGLYTRTTTKAYNRQTGAFLDELETVRYVTFVEDAAEGWLVDSMTVEYSYTTDEFFVIY